MIGKMVWYRSPYDVKMEGLIIGEFSEMWVLDIYTINGAPQSEPLTIHVSKTNQFYNWGVMHVSSSSNR
jgi:hypothetical protein